MVKVSTLAECMAEGRSPEILFWVGCAGSFDERAKKITKAFVKLLQCWSRLCRFWEQRKAVQATLPNVPGTNSFSMQAMTNIEVMNAYEVKKIVTCPHCFNTFKKRVSRVGREV